MALLFNTLWHHSKCWGRGPFSLMSREAGASPVTEPPSLAPPGPQTAEGAHPHPLSPQTVLQPRAYQVVHRAATPGNKRDQEWPVIRRSVTRPDSPARTGPGMQPSEESRVSRSRGLTGMSLMAKRHPSPWGGREKRNIIQKLLVGFLAHQTLAIIPGQWAACDSQPFSTNHFPLALLLAQEELGRRGPWGSHRENKARIHSQPSHGHGVS